jgi:hypothetical protein
MQNCKANADTGCAIYATKRVITEFITTKVPFGVFEIHY